MTEVLFVEAPFGKIGVAAQGEFITKVFFSADAMPENCLMAKNNAVLLKAAKQLAEYFSGRRREFDLPLFFEGTPFQKSVWRELMKIPYGETRSYQDVAAALGNKKATRAVGMANNKNPLSIFIPCHRVVGKNGKLVGYGGGLDAKERLLKIEGSER